MIGTCPREAHAVSDLLLYNFPPFSYFPLSVIHSKSFFLCQEIIVKKKKEIIVQLDLITEGFPISSELRLSFPLSWKSH